MTRRGLLVNGDTGLTLASDAHVATALSVRLIGLMGRRIVAPDYALGIPDCDWVHTFGVLLPLDVAYCDRNGLVLLLVENLPPNRISPRASGAWVAWEMKSGGFSGHVREGQRLLLQPLEK